jgi:hypothetical protein
MRGTEQMIAGARSAGGFTPSSSVDDILSNIYLVFLK